MNKPNILFLFSDQHNARCLSCAGHPDVKTPNLDELASQGIRFTNAYTNNPICTPSRMSFLSGLYPSTHGYYGLYGHAPNDNITSIFKHFKQNGYRTGALGKLHTPRYWVEQDCQFVYDEFIEYPKYLEGAGLYEKNDNRRFTGNRDGEISQIPLEHSCEMALVKQAIRFIRNEGEPKDRGEANKPWFAWVSFSRPHEPYTPSEPFASMYDLDNITLPPAGNKEKMDNLEKLLNAYLALVSQVDYGIERIIEELVERDEFKNTIIIYTSDHGDYAGEHGSIRKMGGISHKAITGIPMIFRVPDMKQTGQVTDEIVEAVDVFPTLCELSGIPIPNTVQGISFAGIIENTTNSIRQNALTENPYRKSLATKEWRYVANLEGQKDELYNLEEDPWELNNKIDDSECINIVQKLSRELLDRVVKARKPVNVANGDWHDHVYDTDGRLDFTQNNKINPYW